MIPGMASATSTGPGRVAGQRIRVVRLVSSREGRRGLAESGKRAAGGAGDQRSVRIRGETGDGFYIAEMHRLRGDILWEYDKNFAGAEFDLGKALKISGAQQSGTFRLRMAMSLLNLTRERHDLPRRRKAQAIAKAKQVLHDVFDSFANEPEFTDVVAARAMIAGASSRGPSETRGSRRARRRTRRNSERND